MKNISMICIGLLLCFGYLYSQDTVLVLKKFTDSKQTFEKYYTLKTNKQTKNGEYICYFPIKDYDKIVKHKFFKIDEYIKIKGYYDMGKKSGEWIEYYSPNKIQTIGRYKDDKKIGIWKTYTEKDRVIIQFDYDNNIKLKPIINLWFRYPEIASENNLEGEASYSYKINSDCSISDIKVISSSDKSFSDSVIKSLTDYGKLKLKYDFNCNDTIIIDKAIFVLK
ncbi:MAG: energy transducer TonB [Bacteroidales bacterium]